MELLEILLIVVGYLKDLQGEQKGKFVHLVGRSIRKLQ